MAGADRPRDRVARAQPTPGVGRAIATAATRPSFRISSTEPGSSPPAPLRIPGSCSITVRATSARPAACQTVQSSSSRSAPTFGKSHLDGQVSQRGHRLHPDTGTRVPAAARSVLRSRVASQRWPDRRSCSSCLWRCRSCHRPRAWPHGLRSHRLGRDVRDRNSVCVYRCRPRVRHRGRAAPAGALWVSREVQELDPRNSAGPINRR
jgi:hypothetical protein